MWLFPFRSLYKDGEDWSLNGEILDGKIYEMAFDGSDAHAEIIERQTGLTFLGDSTRGL